MAHWSPKLFIATSHLKSRESARDQVTMKYREKPLLKSLPDNVLSLSSFLDWKRKVAKRVSVIHFVRTVKISACSHNGCLAFLFDSLQGRFELSVFLVVSDLVLN